MSGDSIPTLTGEEKPPPPGGGRVSGSGLPAILADLLARSHCVRCGGPLRIPEDPDTRPHIGWDPAGIVCDYCWLEEVGPALDKEWAEACAEHAVDMATLGKGE